MQNRAELDIETLAALKALFRSHFNYDSERPARFYHDAQLSAQLHEYAANLKGSLLDQASSFNQVYELFVQAFAKSVATKYSRKIEQKRGSCFSFFYTPTADVRGEFDSYLARAIERYALVITDVGDGEAARQLDELVYRFQQLPNTLRDSSVLQLTTLEKVIADYLRTGKADKRLNDLFTSARLKEVDYASPATSGNTLFNTRFVYSREGSYQVPADPALFAYLAFDYPKTSLTESYTAYHFDIEPKQVDLPKPSL